MVSGYLPLVRVQYMYPYIKSLQCSEGETAGQIDLKLKFYHRPVALSALWSFFYIWFGFLNAQVSSGNTIARQWSHEQFAILTLRFLW